MCNDRHFMLSIWTPSLITRHEKDSKSDSDLLCIGGPTGPLLPTNMAHTHRACALTCSPMPTTALYRMHGRFYRPLPINSCLCASGAAAYQLMLVRIARAYPNQGRWPPYYAARRSLPGALACEAIHGCARPSAADMRDEGVYSSSPYTKSRNSASSVPTNAARDVGCGLTS